MQLEVFLMRLANKSKIMSKKQAKGQTIRSINIGAKFKITQQGTESKPKKTKNKTEMKPWQVQLRMQSYFAK